MNPAFVVTKGQIYVQTAAMVVKKIRIFTGPYLTARTPPARRPNAEVAFAIDTT